MAVWRVCPRRWWLENSRFAGDKNRYPRRAHPSNVEGTVVHGVLNRFASFIEERSSGSTSEYESVRRAFPVRREVLRQLNAMCDTQLSDNPRVDLQQVRARVDVDACINAFRRAAPALWHALRRLQGSAATKQESASEPSHLPPTAAEKWLEVGSPRIAGQIDVIARGVVIDYKTGERKEEHWEQLRFYALLHWLCYGRAVRLLRLVYTATGDTLDADAPSVDELAQRARELSLEISAIDRLLVTGEAPPAYPATELCGTCSVRHLCDDFWVANAGWQEASYLANTDGRPTSWWDDVEVRLPSSMTVSNGYAGQVTTSAWGTVAIRIGSSKSPADEVVVGARLLGVRIERTRAGIEISATKDCEVFWSPSA